MTDFIKNGTGDSRFLKSAISPTDTWEQARQKLIDGDFPIDMNGFNPSGILEQGTPLNKATFLTDAVATLFGLGTNAVPNDVFEILHASKVISDKNRDIIKNLMLRDLQIMLNLTLNSSNIDAWCDLLDDDSMLNTGMSSNYEFSGGGGVYTTADLLTQPTDDEVFNIVGYQSSFGAKAGQTFRLSEDAYVLSIVTKMRRVGTVSDDIILKVYASDKATLLATSVNTITGSTISLSASFCTFYFSGVGLSLQANTTYFLEISRTGSYSTSNYYKAFRTSSNVYADGQSYKYDGSWISEAFDLRFTVNYRQKATLVWNSTASEPFSVISVVSEVQTSDGTISYFVSQNGSTWLPITLEEIKDVNFTVSSIYVKAEILGIDVLNGIAWGGY